MFPFGATLRLSLLDRFVYGCLKSIRALFIAVITDRELENIIYCFLLLALKSSIRSIAHNSALKPKFLLANVLFFLVIHCAAHSVYFFSSICEDLCVYEIIDFDFNSFLILLGM